MSTLTKKLISEKGITDQPKRLRKKVKIGAKMKLKVLAFVGITVSFNNSLIPSAAGCNKPKNPTSFGPNLCCMPPMTFLSANVK